MTSWIIERLFPLQTIQKVAYHQLLLFIILIHPLLSSSSIQINSIIVHLVLLLGMLFMNGEIVKSVKEEDIADELMKMAEEYAKNTGKLD